MSVVQTIGQILLNSIDFIVAPVVYGTIAYLDYIRRKEITKEEWVQLESIVFQPEERNITANVAARSIQAGITIGGFLFAALFTILFHPPFSDYSADVIIALVWTAISLSAGAVNISLLPTFTLTGNFVATPVFGHILRLQFCTLVGTFVRMIVLVVKHLSPHL